MKGITTLFLALILVSNGASALSLEELTDKISQNNYSVLENAEKVYQAKEKISVMRGNLLPKLNLWKILTIPMAVMNPWMAGGLVNDIAPFLIPANWLNVKKSRWNYKASLEQHRAIWANEVFHARQLYLEVARDLELLNVLDQLIERYEFIREYTENRVLLGLEPSHQIDSIEAKFLRILEDRRVIFEAHQEQIRTLLFILGEDLNHPVEIEFSYSDIHPEYGTKIPEEFVLKKALASSPELIQFKFLLASLKAAKKSLNFVLLGTSPLSSQAGHGVYDNIPSQNGLGFGTAPSIKISKSKAKELSIREKASAATIELQTRNNVSQYNSLLVGYSNIQKQVELSIQAYETLIQSMNLGRETKSSELVNLLNAAYSATVLGLFTKYEYLRLSESVSRLTFSPPYDGLPSHGGLHLGVAQ